MEKIFIQEITKEEWTEQEGVSSKGKRVKGWFQRNSDGVLFLYKEPKVRDFVLPEIWTEFIAYKIGEFLNLDVPVVIPAKNDGFYGVLIRRFIENNEQLNIELELIEAREIFFREKVFYHNLAAIKHILNIDELDEFAWRNFKKMMIFDCLIGNNDRHDENWGLLFDLETLKFKLAPFYDNASCLTQQLDKTRILKMLQEKNLIEKYVNNSRPPNLYLDPFNPHKPTHYEIMQFLIENELDMKDLINELLQKDYTDYVDAIMSNIQQLDVPEEYKLSDNRRKVILEILKLRRQKLKELL